jgi:GNAT superfamily N-acetyltransferase
VASGSISEANAFVIAIRNDMDMTMNIHDTTIRRANAEDSWALVELLREPCVAITGQDRHAGPGSADNIAIDEIIGEQVDTVVAEAREGLQGVLQLRWGMRPPSMSWIRGSVELKQHYVRARHRGAGVASRMLESALRLAEQREAACIWLKVRKDSSQAVHFYQQHGFRIAGTTLFRDGVLPHEGWVMHRTLPVPHRAGYHALM